MVYLCHRPLHQPQYGGQSDKGFNIRKFRHHRLHGLVQQQTLPFMALVKGAIQHPQISLHHMGLRQYTPYVAGRGMVAVICFGSVFCFKTIFFLLFVLKRHFQGFYANAMNDPYPATKPPLPLWIIGRVGGNVKPKAYHGVKNSVPATN